MRAVHDIDSLALFFLIVSGLSLLFAALQALWVLQAVVAWLYLRAVKDVGLAPHGEEEGATPGSRGEDMKGDYMRGACAV